jgi:hypothetical protein
MKQYYEDIIQILSEGHIHCMAVQPVVSPWPPLGFVIIRFYDVGLLAMHSNPSSPGGPMGCVFIWLLPTNQPGKGGPTSSKLLPV